MKKATNQQDFIEQLGSLYDGLRMAQSGLEQARVNMEKEGASPEWEVSFKWWLKRVESWKETILSFIGTSAEQFKEYLEERL